MDCRRMILRSLLLILAFFAADLVRPSHAVWFDLHSSGIKCVSEEIRSNVVVLGNYVVHSENGTYSPTVSVKVTSPYGNNLFHKENETHGQFAFTTAEVGNHMACFWIDSHHQGGGDASIFIDWKTGISAKDWESVAKKEKIEGVELELRKLEGVVEAIRENLVHMKNREANMRIRSEKTNARVAWFSIMSLGVCIVSSALQLVYLKRYFQRKKLI